jgi:RNA polymerase sigma-70 factor, ECF subfamily
LSAATPSQPRQRIASIHRLPISGVDDAALARAAAEGDPRAASAIWDRFSPLVRGLLRRSIGPGSEVEDAVQDVFLRFFRNLGTLRDPEAVRSFLIGITIRVAHSELRRRRFRRWLRLTDTGAVPEQEATAFDPEAREALTRLYAALDRLDDESRLAFVLRHVESLELDDVARALDVSLATTKRRLTKATSRLHAMVSRDAVLAAYVTAPSPDNRPHAISEESSHA